jgi:hypothetical protein
VLLVTDQTASTGSDVPMQQGPLLQGLNHLAGG